MAKNAVLCTTIHFLGVQESSFCTFLWLFCRFFVFLQQTTPTI